MLSVNSFNEPTEYKNRDSVALLLLRLFLLEPGTNNARPEMGLGIVSRYRFSTDQDMDSLRTDIRTQINTYLPELTLHSISLELKNTILYITIQVNDEYYGYNLDTETKILTLSDLRAN